MHFALWLIEWHDVYYWVGIKGAMIWNGVERKKKEGFWKDSIPPSPNTVLKKLP